MSFTMLLTNERVIIIIIINIKLKDANFVLFLAALAVLSRPI